MRRRVIIYARFRRDWLSVRLVGTEHRWEDRPEMAIDRPTGRILAIGTPARLTPGAGTVVLSGFDSDHAVLHDYHVACAILRRAIRHVYRARWGLLSSFMFRSVPSLLVLHPLAPAFPMNGFEREGLIRVGRECEVSHTQIWDGRELSDMDFANGVITLEKGRE